MPSNRFKINHNLVFAVHSVHDSILPQPHPQPVVAAARRLLGGAGSHASEPPVRLAPLGQPSKGLATVRSLLVSRGEEVGCQEMRPTGMLTAVIMFPFTEPA
jgi:hypothetical protein